MDSNYADNLLENGDNLKGLCKFTKYMESQHIKNLNEMTQLFSIKLYNSHKTKAETAITQLWITEDRRT